MFDLFGSNNKRDLQTLQKLSKINNKNYIKFMARDKIEDLESFISEFKKEELISLAKAYNINFEKYDRKKLVISIKEAYINKKFTVLFNLLDEKEIKIIDKLINLKLQENENKEYIIVYSKNLLEYATTDEERIFDYLKELGLSLTYLNKEEKSIEYYMPIEIIEGYLKCKKNLQEGEKVLKYLGKIISLTGICKLDRVYKMLNLCIDRSIDYETFLIYVFGYNRTYFDSYIYGEYLVDENVKEEKSEQYIAIQNKYDVYNKEILSKETIDLYDKDKSTISPILISILKELNLDNNKKIINQINDYLRFEIDVNIKGIIKIIEKSANKKLNLNTYFKEFKLLMIDTRMYKYAGYKEREVDETLTDLVDITNFKINKKSGIQNKNVKIGRNEPCPCGSGRKYKHCCGK